MLIHRARLDRGKDVVEHEFLTQVFHNHLAGAGRVRFLDHRIQIIALSYVGNVSDHVAIVVFFQPRNNDGGIETSGICQYDFLTHMRSSAESDGPRLPAIKP